MRKTIPVLLLFVVIGLPAIGGDGRRGEIRLTDGSAYKGDILAKGKMRLVTWPEDELGIDSQEDLAEYGDGEWFTGFYGKEHHFSLEKVKSIRLEPRPDLESREKPAERMERKWDWKTLAEYGGPAPNEKTYIGEPFPVRELQAVVTFNNGVTMRGELTKDAIYIYPEGSFTAKKFILRSKVRGEEGQSLDDLVHVKSIRFLEEGRTFPKSHRITIKDLNLDQLETVWAISRQTLTGLDLKPVSDKPNVLDVSGVFGEGIFLAVKYKGDYVVGWRNHGSDKLWETARRHVKEMRDFYNQRKLIGVRRIGDSNEVLTLVRYRRQVPETSVRDKPPEDLDLPEKNWMQYWRVGIWRWRHHPKTNEMILMNRGSFFRKKLDNPSVETPKIHTTTALWIDQNKNLPERITVSGTAKNSQ